MPYLGLPSFLLYDATDEELIEECVNALSRAPFISTVFWAYADYVDTLCQCPISGSLHFYFSIDALPEIVEMVSMPYLGLPSFLPGERGLYV